MDRMIYRLAYDGNYERAIQLLVDEIVKLKKEVEVLKNDNNDRSDRTK